MSIRHWVTGYDKHTERLAYKFDVPEDRLAELRTLAFVEGIDVEAVGSYPLSDDAARSVADSLNLPMQIDRCDWFLEPIARG